MEKTVQNGDYLDGCARLLRGCGMGPADAFAALLGEFCGTPFAEGGADIDGCDGAGSICACLTAVTGRALRAGADALLRSYFTLPARPGSVAALFLLDAAGTARLAAGYLGGGLYLYAPPGSPYGASAVTAQQVLPRHAGLRPVVRSLRGDILPPQPKEEDTDNEEESKPHGALLHGSSAHPAGAGTDCGTARRAAPAGSAALAASIWRSCQQYRTWGQ